MEERFSPNYHHPEKLLKSFGSNLSYLRNQRELTQSELADALGISQSSIANYETGRREPSMDQLYRISRFFEVDIDMLITQNLRPPKPTLSLNLSYLRKREGYSKEEMAKLLDYPSVHRFNMAEDSPDGGLHMNIPKLLVISEFFGVSIDDLLKKDLSKGGI